MQVKSAPSNFLYMKIPETLILTINLFTCSWPSMQGGFPLQRRKLDLQLRASQIRAPPGRTLWSSPVHLDALGGAAVVSVPCPMSGTASAVLDHRAAYVLAVTATQVRQ